MAQLSRPYQFGLLGIVLLAAVWLVLLQGHSSSTSGSGSSASAPAVQTVTTTTTTSAAAKQSSQAPNTKIYTGSAPGVGGLTRAIAKAQGAVNTSQQNARALAEKSAVASNESPTAGQPASSASSSSPAAAAPAKAVAGTPSTTAKAPAKTTPPSRRPPTPRPTARRPSTSTSWKLSSPRARSR